MEENSLNFVQRSLFCCPGSFLLLRCFKFKKGYCIHTLPRGGMHWEIHPPKDREISQGWGFCKNPAPLLTDLYKNVLTFCKYLHCVYLHHCIAGALPMFSLRGCVSDIDLRECIKKYCPKGNIFKHTP